MNLSRYWIVQLLFRSRCFLVMRPKSSKFIPSRKFETWKSTSELVPYGKTNCRSVLRSFIWLGPSTQRPYTCNSWSKLTVPWNRTMNRKSTFFWFMSKVPSSKQFPQITNKVSLVEWKSDILKSFSEISVTFFLGFLWSTCFDLCQIGFLKTLFMAKLAKQMTSYRAGQFARLTITSRLTKL